MSNYVIAKAGTLMLVDEGEYSEHMVHGVYKVLQDFSPGLLLDRYFKEHPDQNESYSFKAGQFMKLLIDGGYLKHMEPDSNLFLGTYSCPNVSFHKYS